MKRRWFLLAALPATTGVRADYGQWVRGKVKALDVAKGRLRLQHEPIEHLDMPAMTMWYRLAEPALFASLAVDVRVMFKAAKLDGRFVITALEVDRPVAPL